jgi:hypothetical protein
MFVSKKNKNNAQIQMQKMANKHTERKQKETTYLGVGPVGFIVGKLVGFVGFNVG